MYLCVNVNTGTVLFYNCCKVTHYSHSGTQLKYSTADCCSYCHIIVIILLAIKNRKKKNNARDGTNQQSSICSYSFF